MKRFKRIIFNILAIVMVFGMCLGLTACEDIKKLEVTFIVFDAEDNKMVEKKLGIDLYRHLAPKTVDHIIKNCVDKKYYDNAILYKANDGVMAGDIVYDEANDTFVKKLPLAPTVKGEFTNNGVKGTNLKVKEGSLVLWRTYAANDKLESNAGFNTGRATWYMPTSSNSSRDGVMTVFGQFDKNNEAWLLVKEVLNSGTDVEEIEQVEYTIYYTEKAGGYDVTKEDCNLEFHCVKTSELPADFGEDDYFTPKGAQLVEYQKRTVKIPYVSINEGTPQLAVSIKSVKLA